MSHRFTPDHKTTILALLQANRGNITLTAEQAGITERTLYRWKRQQELTQPPQSERQTFPLTLDASESQEEAENELLRRLLRQAALQLASELTDNVHAPDLLRRVNALNGLLDRLGLMEQGDPNAAQTRTLQIEYVDAVGKVYAAPPWATSDDNDE